MNPHENKHHAGTDGETVIVPFDSADADVKKASYAVDYAIKLKALIEIKSILPDDFSEESRKKIEFDIIRAHIGRKIEESKASRFYEKYNDVASILLFITFALGFVYFIYKVGKYFFVENALFEYQIPAFMMAGSVVVFILHLLLAIFIGFSLNLLIYCYAKIVWKFNLRKSARNNRESNQ